MSLSMMESSFFAHDLSSSSFLDTSSLFDEIVGNRPCNFAGAVDALAVDAPTHVGASACAHAPPAFSSSPHVTDHGFAQPNIMMMMDPLLLDTRSLATAAPHTTMPSVSVPPPSNNNNSNNNSNNIVAAAAFIAAAAAAAAQQQQQQQQHSSVEPASILNAINFAANQFAQQQQHVQPSQIAPSSGTAAPAPTNLATLAAFNLPPTKLLKKQKTAAVSVKSNTTTGRSKKHQPVRLLPLPTQPQRQQQQQAQPQFVLDMLKREQSLPQPARSVSGTSQRLSLSSTSSADDGFHSESSSPCSPSAHYISDASVTSIDDSLTFAPTSSSSSSSVPSSSSSPSFQASSSLPSSMSSSSSSSCSDETDPTKAKRLARKAELARMSRKRKATRMGDLEAEVERLQKEIGVLKKAKQDRDIVEAHKASVLATNNAAAAASLHVADDDNGNGNEMQAVNAALNQIVAAFHASQAGADSSSSSSSSAVDRSIESFVAAHTVASNSALKHLSTLQHHAHAILPLQFFQWLCSQPDSFYEASASSSSSSSCLWMNLFVKELGLNEQQMKDLNALKTTVRKQTKICNDIEKAYKKLNMALKKQVSQRVENLEKIRSILSSGQLARFVDWTNKYAQVCLKIHLQDPANSNCVTTE